MSLCEVCGKNESVGVACIPGLPMSAAYCLDCLKAGAHPLGALIANTACCGGLEHCDDWWKSMVEVSLKHLGKTKEWFEAEVAESIKQFDNFEGGKLEYHGNESTI